MLPAALHTSSLLVALALVPPREDPTLENLKGQLSQSLHDAHFASGFVGLILLSDEFELSSARYEIDNEVGTELATMALPFHTTLQPWGDEAPGLYLEGVVGYSRARESVADLYGGELPGLETSVDAEWTTYGALGGVGLEFELAERLTLAPIFNLGVARIESQADYAGPGAGFTAALADGIAFNWNAWTTMAGGAARLDWIRPLSDRHELEVVGRYDLRFTRTFDEDDAAQDFSSRAQFLSLRADVTGPTGLAPFGRPLGWRTLLGYRQMIEGNIYGVEAFVQLGGALELDVEDWLPLGSKVSISGALAYGEDLTGWTLGVGLSF